LATGSISAREKDLRSLCYGSAELPKLMPAYNRNPGSRFLANAQFKTVLVSSLLSRENGDPHHRERRLPAPLRIVLGSQAERGSKDSKRRRNLRDATTLPPETKAFKMAAPFAI
jgi:hypothetical protein